MDILKIRHYGANGAAPIYLIHVRVRMPTGKKCATMHHYTMSLLEVPSKQLESPLECQQCQHALVHDLTRRRLSPGAGSVQAPRVSLQSLRPLRPWQSLHTQLFEITELHW